MWTSSTDSIRARAGHLYGVASRVFGSQPTGPLRKFCGDRGGNYAVIFALMSLPLLGAVGIAVDYARAVNVRSFLQQEADGAALTGVHLSPKGDASAVLAYMRSAVLQRYGSINWIDRLTIEGEWVSQTDFRVTARGVVPVTILAAVPGFPDDVPISVQATARIPEPRFIYMPPTVMQLDPEASDYNRMYVYCFDPKTSSDPKTHGRTQMIAIADNAGTQYTYTMPICDAGQMLSYQLMNVRDARTKPKRWDSKSAERYRYYTDTILRHNAEAYDLDNRDILETVLCDKLNDCRPKDQGGIIPEGPNRTPQRTNKVCSPGKYMYYGWEDRPPGAGWTDRDYNDIRIIIGCPTTEKIGDLMVRLIE